MKVAIFDAAGGVVMFMDAAEDQIALNVPEGGRFEEVSAEEMDRLAGKPDPEPAP